VTRLPALAALATVLLASAACGASARAGPAAVQVHAAPPRPVHVTSMLEISGACAGQNSEVEEARAAPGYVFADWIGCGGIGFARSVNDGGSWSRGVMVPGSAGDSWDPSIAVGPDGTLYVAYMHHTVVGRSAYMQPMVAVSRNHGASFAFVSADMPPVKGNWGDRDFITVSRTGKVYLTWDYGPSAAEVKLLCSGGGSCAYSAGDMNAVIQTSVNGGKTWGPITHLEPDFPIGGGYAAPLVTGSNGSVDVVYIGHPTTPGTLKLHPGWEWFTSSRDGVHWPAHTMKLWPSKGTLSLPEWWIDGDIGVDAAGNLYITWDTQTAAGDIGWLTWSTDGGSHWSAPVRVTPDTDHSPHITEVAGNGSGTAYVGWQTSAGGHWSTYLRPFSIRSGWTAPAIRVSARSGNEKIWPGDTFGMSVFSPGEIGLTWGSAVGTSKNSEIYASEVSGLR
jgi:hypothetical protein